MSSYKLIEDHFLCGILGRPVYFFKSPVETLSNSKFPQPPCFIYNKTKTCEIEDIKKVEHLGFHLIDTNLIFCLKKKNFVEQLSLPPRYSMRWSCSTDCDVVGNIARNNFKYSRFHLDPLIENSVADDVKKAWATNFFSGTRGDHMIVSCYDEQPVGFTQILHQSKNELVIDLIAVDLEHRGKGLASRMISFMMKELFVGLPDSALIKVGTQIANIPSIALYQKMGFQVTSSTYVFHYHG